MGDICLVQSAMPKQPEPVAYIDLLVVESLLEIIIDSFIRDCAKKRHVSYTSLLLLS
jgi:hypothetical protein